MGGPNCRLQEEEEKDRASAPTFQLACTSSQLPPSKCAIRTHIKSLPRIRGTFAPGTMARARTYPWTSEGTRAMQVHTYAHHSREQHSSIARLLTRTPLPPLPLYADLGARGNGFVHTSYALLRYPHAASSEYERDHPPRHLVERYPHWFSNGNATGQLCWSEPSLIAYLIRQSRLVLREQPNAKVLSISQMDGDGW